jgi:predicted phosphodiesterase
MQIGYLSDIHIDFYVKLNKPKLLKTFITSLNPDFYDILIIAGDIGHYNQQNILLLKHLKEYANKIIVVSGNHDLYLPTYRMQKKYQYNSLKRVEEFKNMCKENEIIFLQNELIEIEGIKIFGGSLWYKIENYQFFKENMNDSKYIFLDFEKFFNDSLKRFKQIETCDILINHIPQTKVSKFLAPNFDKKYLQFYEIENIELLKEKQVKYHIYGHNHTQGNFIKENIQFLTNSIGYPSEQLSKKIDSFII